MLESQDDDDDRYGDDDQEGGEVSLVIDGLYREDRTKITYHFKFRL